MLAPRKRIAILPPAVAQRIATGEIVERPASVLRELIENALDAGAQEVRIAVRGAGLELISVSDDGQGIPFDELRLAFARHATSKVTSLEDLDSITTLGFRGEALPSIASVSAVEVISATEENPLGARLLLREGAVLEEGRVARTRGTTVQVRELFAGQAVRRAALPPARSESALLQALVRRYTLAAPEVRFSLQLDGKDVFRAAGLGEQSALAAVFGSNAGRLRSFGPLTAGPARIGGQLGDPGFTRADREGIVVILNGRWVQPARWLRALERAYSPLLHRGRHPIAVLRVEVDPALVNVTAHPAKLEARLASEDEALTVLAAALHAALGRTPAAAALLELPRRSRQVSLPRIRTSLREDSAAYEAVVPDMGQLRVLTQVLNFMILAEDAQAMYLIDQHRADERALYERLVGERAASSSQELLEPLSVELRPAHVAGLDSALPELERLGFRCERFGRRTFLVRAVPAGLPPDTGKALAATLDEGLLEGPDWRDRLVVSVACRAAVRRGQQLTMEEMQTLLSRLAGCTVQTICPHGSPIVAQVSMHDLARHFEWR